MKIIMGADPAGFELKNAIKADLLKKGYDITDIDPEALNALCHRDCRFLEQHGSLRIYICNIVAFL